MPVSTAIEDARTRYAQRNPASLAAFESASAALPGGGTRTTLATSPFPLFVASGTGARITDLDGHVYLDFLSDYTAGLFGKDHVHIHAAISEALAAGLQFGGHTINEAKFAAGLVARFPSIDMIRFANSGTEANLLAIAAALRYTKRKKVLVFSGAYHGSLLCGFTPDDPHAEKGSVLRAPFDFVVAPYNDLEGTTALVTPDVGAIIVEPMLGAGGCVPADPVFLIGLRDLATRTGTVLIFDEVQTARLSTGGRQKLLGITPDMTTLGKFFGGGFAFGAFGGKKEIMSMFDSSRPGAVSHGGTFNNAPLTMAAGAAALDVLTEPALDALNTLGDVMRAELNTKLAGTPFSVTGLGSVNQLHCKEGADALELLYFLLLEKGFWVAQRGTIALSLAHSPEDVEAYVEAVVQSAHEVVAAL